MEGLTGAQNKLWVFYTCKYMTRSVMLKYIKNINFIYFMPTTKRDQNHAFNKCTRSKLLNIIMNIDYLLGSTCFRLCPDVKYSRCRRPLFHKLHGFYLHLLFSAGCILSIDCTVLFVFFFNSTVFVHKASLFHHFPQPLPCISPALRSQSRPTF